LTWLPKHSIKVWSQIHSGLVRDVAAWTKQGFMCQMKSGLGFDVTA